MPSPDLDISVGYTLSSDGANSAWTPQIVDVTPPAIEVEDVPTSHQGTTTAATHTPSDLRENGQLVIEHHFKADEEPTVSAANEEWVLTYPDAETATFQGYVLTYAPASHVLNGKMMAATTIQVSGTIA